MENNNHELMNKLLLKIKQLDESLASKKNKHIHDDYFDSFLFKPSLDNSNYQHYIDEIYDNYHHLSKLIATSPTQLERVNYLTEKLTNQITALSREAATLKVRNKYAALNNKSTQNIYEKHAKHLDYLRQLEEKKLLLEQTHKKQPSYKTENDIAIMIQRIGRCKAAIIQLEKELDNNQISL